MHNLEQFRYSYSSSMTFDSCARKLEFKKFYPSSARDRSLPGDVGKALHIGYQSYVVHGDRDRAIFDMQIAYPVDLNSNPTNLWSVEACYPTLNLMMDSGAFLEYEIAEIVCLDGKTRKAVEVPFQIDIKNFSLSDVRHIPVIYVGYIDLILRDRIMNEYLVTDIKTTRNNIIDLTPNYYFDEQCIPYDMILESILGHSLDSLLVKYMSVYVDIDKPKVTPYEFRKSREDIEDWARGLLIDLQKIKMYYNMGWFKRSPKACLAYKRVCEYFVHRNNN